MANFETHEQAVEAWTEVAKAHLSNVKKAGAEQRALARNLKALDARLKGTGQLPKGTSPLKKGTNQLQKGTGQLQSDARAYYALCRELNLEMLAQLEALNLVEKNLPTPAAKATVEHGKLRVNVMMVRLAAIDYHRVLQNLEADLALALAGEPPIKPLPQAYMAIRGEIREDKDWGKTLNRFVQDAPLFLAEVARIEAALPEIEALPTAKEQLAALQALNVAACSGQRYRLEGLFRLLPGGEAVVASLGIPRVKPVAEAPAAQGQAQAPAGAPEQKRNITDRLQGFFKKS